MHEPQARRDLTEDERALIPRIGKGASVIGMIAGVITFLALFGSSLPPTSPAGRKG